MIINRLLKASKNKKYLTKRKVKNIKRYQSSLRLSTLPNQVRVATNESPIEGGRLGDIVSVGVFVQSGSVFENDQNNGVSNLLTKLAFVGKCAEFQKLGAQVEKIVEKEQIGFVAVSHKDNAEKLISLLAEGVQNPVLTNEAIESAKGELIEAKDRFEDSGDVIYEHLHACAFQGTPLARSTFGEIKSLSGLKRESVVNFHNTHFTGPRVLVTVNGGLNHNQAYDYAGKYFTKVPSGLKFDFNSLGNFDFVGSEMRIRDDTEHECQAVIAFKGAKLNDPDYYKLKLIKILFGSYHKYRGGGKNLSSRCAERVGLEDVAIEFEHFNLSYNGNGLFGYFYRGDAGTDLDNGIYGIQNEWMKTARDLSNTELERAKNMAKYLILKNWKSPYTFATKLSKQIFNNGELKTLNQIFAEIDSISVSDIKCALSTYLNDVDPAVVAIGATETFPEYLYIRGRTYWYRW